MNDIVITKTKTGHRIKLGLYEFDSQTKALEAMKQLLKEHAFDANRHRDVRDSWLSPKFPYGINNGEQMEIALEYGKIVTGALARNTASWDQHGAAATGRYYIKCTGVGCRFYFGYWDNGTERLCLITLNEALSYWRDSVPARIQ